MVGRFFLFLFCVSTFSKALFAFELQKKLVFQKVPVEFKKNKKIDLAGVSWFPHSKYDTMDLYLDTHDFKLNKMGLSLRLRRVYGKYDKVLTSFQLKSEMTAERLERVEIEEENLNLEMIKKQSIASRLLNVNKDNLNEIEKLEKWVNSRRKSYLSPFQELRHKKIIGSNLKVQFISFSNRDRYHVYINRDKARGSFARVGFNDIEIVPNYFTNSKQNIWIAEASLDKSVFYKIDDYKIHSSPIEIQELEIENKYFLKDQGVEVLYLIEKNIIKAKGAKKELLSKYAQAIQLFKEKRLN